MRWLIALTLGLGLALQGKAQAPYTGGAGDGYAHAGTTVQVGEAPVTEARAELGMREEDGQWTVLLQYEGVETSVEVEVYDLRGRRLTHWTTTAQGGWEEQHPLRNWPGAVYIFRIKIDDQYEFTEKVLNPYTDRQ